MIYSDTENLEWWKRLADSDKVDILTAMFDQASTKEFRAFVVSVTERYEMGKPLTASQIGAIRKWAK